jgi:transposase
MTTVAVLSGPERRRRWTSAEKQRIVEESFAPEASVAEVARRHDVHPNLLHGWRRQARAGALACAVEPDGGVHFAAVGDERGQAGKGGWCWWYVKADLDGDGKPIKDSEKIYYRPYTQPSKLQATAVASHQEYRVCRPIMAKDEDDNVYDVTRALMEELSLHPFAPHDDLADATSRVYDLQPRPAKPFEQQGAEPAVYADS